MSEIDELRAENERLRQLLADYNIDPDPPPAVTEPEQYGPPTLLEHITIQAFKRYAEKFVQDIPRWEADLKWLQGKTWPSTLRIKLPKTFTINNTSR